MQNKGSYQFENYRADLSQRVLMREGKILRITPKAFDLLVVLLERSGRVVPRDELIERVWPDTAVEPNNLAYQIKALRDVLGDSNDSPHYIEGLPRRGYRFIPKVTFAQDGEDEPQPTNLNDSFPQSVVAPVASPAAGPEATFGIHPKLILTLALLSVVAAGVDYLLVRPAGAAVIRDAVLVTLAAAGFFVYAKSSKSRIKQRTTGPETAAFRGLLSFDRSDAARFYGREIDIAALFDLVTHSDFRFGVLYGDSGAGKSSLIRAGLLPRLGPAGLLTIYCRSFKNPIASLLEQSRAETGIAPSDGESPESYLLRICERIPAKVLIVFDQFEEFLTDFGEEAARNEFVSFVARCFHDSRLPVRFLISLRSDFLYLVASAFDDQIPETLATSRRYELQQFTETQAAEVIELSMRRANWDVEIGLSKEVARDLAVNGRVMPSEIQIIGQQLQNRRIFTIEGYNRAGRKEQLVYGYLADVVKLTGDEETAHLVLRSLVSDEDTRLTLALPEIARRSQRSTRNIERVLTAFVNNRIVSVIQDEQQSRYELAHEYAIGLVNRMTGRVLDARQRANVFFRRYLSDYEFDPRTRIPLRRWWFIRRYSDINAGSREKALLNQSLRGGVIRAAGLLCLIVIVVSSSVAILSVREEWEPARLRDGHTAAVHRAVFSPDGKRLVSGAEDGRVIVWDFDKRRKIAELTEHSGWVHSIAFSPDGRLFATGGYDHTLIVWETDSLRPITTIAQETAVVATAFSPDGRFLAIVCKDGPATVWTVGEWQKRWSFSETNRSTWTVMFADNGRLLNTGGPDAWDLDTGRKTSFVPGMIGYATSDAVFANESRLATIDSTGTVAFFDLRRGAIGSRKAHRDNGRAVAASRDGRVVATGAEDVILWDGETLEKIVRLEYPSVVWSLDFSPDGRWLASSHGDGSIVIWDVLERERVANLNEHIDPVRSVCFSRDGKLVASASEDRSVIVWDAEHGTKLQVLVGHENRVTGLAFSTDSKALYSTDQDGLTVCWDLITSQPRWKQQASSGNMCLALSPSGRWLAASHAIYEAVDGKEIASSREGTRGRSWPSWGGWGISFSPDNRWLICPANDGALWVLDTDDWQVKEHQPPPNFSPVAVGFSAAGDKFVTGDDFGDVRLWHLDPLRGGEIIGRHAARVKSVSMSPDGTEVVSSSDDKTVALWDTRGALKGVIGTHAAPVISVGFSPDGKRIVCGGQDNQVLIYTRHRSLFHRTADWLPMMR